MEDNSANVAKMTRILAITHLIVGLVLICLGIADRVVEFADFPYSSTGDVYFGIWTGAWMCITGGLGIPGSSRETTGSRNAFAGVFMGFSITSAALGGLIILCYGISINESRERKQREYLENYDASMAIRAFILILGIVEFVIGVWAAICCCQMTGCTCCATPHQGHQWSFTSNPSDYVMTQGPDGVTVAVPIQSGGGVVTFQAPLVLEPKEDPGQEV